MDNSEFCDLVLNCIMTEQTINYEDFDLCSEYGEKGYTQPEKCVILANWNNIPDNVADLFEECGYTLEWSDEWYIDHGNSKAYRTSPNSYGWECLIHFTDNGEILTPDDDLGEICVTDYNQPHKALNNTLLAEIGGEISEQGYILLNDDDRPYQSGLHIGMNDDPVTISKKLFEELEGLDSLIYVITQTSQFYIEYEVWGKFE